MQTNIIREGNNVDVLKRMPTDSIDLAYADPPFNTGRNFCAEIGGYSDSVEEGSPDLPPDFNWLSHITTPTQMRYFSRIIPSLLEIYRVLKKRTGAFYYHCDWRTSPMARCILNQIFGQNCFRNEIAWMYQVSAPFDLVSKIFVNTQDSLLFYAGTAHDFHPLTYQLRNRSRSLEDKLRFSTFSCVATACKNAFSSASRRTSFPSALAS